MSLDFSTSVSAALATFSIHQVVPLRGAVEHKFCAHACTELRNSHLFIGEPAAWSWNKMVCHYATFFIVGITMPLLFWRKQLCSENSNDLSKCFHYCWVSASTRWLRSCFFSEKCGTTHQLVGPILLLWLSFCITAPSEFSRSRDAWWASQ